MKVPGMERNKLDYILTDLLPVEVSSLFSFYEFYKYLSRRDVHRKLEDIVEELKKLKVGRNQLFKSGWASCPLKYKILKSTDSKREMSILTPYAALNIYFFMECYQKDILIYFDENHAFSIRYHSKNKQLYHKTRLNHVTEYFHKEIRSTGKSMIQQAGNYFQIKPFPSINAFEESKIWRISNFRYKYFAKTDYKSCFDSIYTHTFNWIIEKDSLDAKKLGRSSFFSVIDRLLQNINGRISNGIVVGPEFSRMMAEILLEHIDKEVMHSLMQDEIRQIRDYKIYRYVDDIFIFANQPDVCDKVLLAYREISGKYQLQLNELKLVKGSTPCLPKDWIQSARRLTDMIRNYFYKGTKSEYNKLDKEKQHIVGVNYIFVDRIKDGVNVLMKTYPSDIRTIVSFLLSTLLNNISKKRMGYRLFSDKDKKRLNKALFLIDLALYIFAFFPSFEQSRKVISIISYIDSEIKFKESDDESKGNTKLERLNKKLNEYSFIFENGNLFDLCDWVTLFAEYKMTFNVNVENSMIKTAMKLQNPILWAILLVYAKSLKTETLFCTIRKEVETIIDQGTESVLDISNLMEMKEFWVVLIFHNCPYISESERRKLRDLIIKLREYSNNSNNKSTVTPSHKTILLICDFLLREEDHKIPAKSFFDWSEVQDFGREVTFRTYQRTIFRGYKRRTAFVDASID